MLPLLTFRAHHRGPLPTSGGFLRCPDGDPAPLRTPAPTPCRQGCMYGKFYRASGVGTVPRAVATSPPYPPPCTGRSPRHAPPLRRGHAIRPGPPAPAAPTPGSEVPGCKGQTPLQGRGWVGWVACSGPWPASGSWRLLSTGLPVETQQCMQACACASPASDPCRQLVHHLQACTAVRSTCPPPALICVPTRWCGSPRSKRSGRRRGCTRSCRGTTLG